MNTKILSKALCGFGVTLMLSTSLAAQTVSGEVFTTTSYDEEKPSFDLSRVEFGIGSELSDTISGKILVNSSRGTEGALDTRIKNAYFEVSDLAPNVVIRAGLQPTQLFKIQEEAWGYQYAVENALELNGFGSAADFGVTGFTTIADQIDLNVAVLNGEGYTSAQDSNGDVKIAAQASSSPVENLTVSAYYDMTSVTDAETASTIALFGGYELEGLGRVGAEFNTQTNVDGVDGTDNQVISLYGTYHLNETINLFGRFDQRTTSITGISDIETDLLVAGVEYSLAEDVKVAASYVDSNEDVSVGLTTSFEF